MHDRLSVHTVSYRGATLDDPQVLGAGYPNGVDPELIGLRIDREGPFEAARRGRTAVARLLLSAGG